MKNNIFKIIMIIILGLIVGYLLFLLSAYLLIKMDLNGEKNINIPYGNTYNDEGIKVSFLKKDLSKMVVVNNNVNHQKIGEYYIKYSINYLGINKIIKRIVNVIDNESPKIELKGDNPLYLNLNEEYIELGYDVSDNYDQTVSVEVTGVKDIDYNKNGEYLVYYKAMDSSGNYTSITRRVIVGDRIIVKNGVTYVEGILIVNKKYSLPSDFENGVNEEAGKQLKLLQDSAKKEGHIIDLISGYRTYEYQKNLYNNYVKKHGEKEANTFSAKPGHSEHQTGLAFDVGKIDNNYGETESGKWLAENAHLYGFIIRYPKEKEAITGYIYEPWHIRYLGVDIATKVYNSGLCLEEYLEI